ncbi:MAG: DUF4363 family protein [Oscillospiraceae bacterium]|nr:DUF4363 family protein [Oscillospiraceae bacterium]
MKKELAAAILLGLILIGCIINSRAVTLLAEELTGLVEDAGEDAISGLWEDAGQDIDDAFALLSRRGIYIGVFLPADDMDRIADSLDNLREQIHSRNAAGTESAVHLALTRLESIASRERVRIGSIF